MEPPPALRALSPLLVRGAPLALLFLLGGCGEAPPTLLQVMYRMDFDDQSLRAALGRGNVAEARAAGERMRAHLGEPAFDSYPKRPDLPQSPERFGEARRSFTAELDRLLAALASGDAATAGRVYPDMRMSCELCHRDFRPGL